MFPLPRRALARLALALVAGTAALVLTVGNTTPAAAARRPPPPGNVCSHQVGAFRFALNEHMRAGVMSPTAYGFILGDLGPVADACRAGDDAAAGRLLREVMRRWRFM